MMPKQRADSDEHESGDKVRVRDGPYAGLRGILAGLDAGTAQVHSDDGADFSVHIDQVTNYSLAARRSWRATPKRAGRPRSDQPPKRTITVRLDATTYELLDTAITLGLVSTRQDAINVALQLYLGSLLTRS